MVSTIVVYECDLCGKKEEKHFELNPHNTPAWKYPEGWRVDGATFSSNRSICVCPVCKAPFSEENKAYEEERRQFFTAWQEQWNSLHKEFNKMHPKPQSSIMAAEAKIKERKETANADA